MPFDREFLEGLGDALQDAMANAADHHDFAEVARYFDLAARLPALGQELSATAARKEATRDTLAAIDARHRAATPGPYTFKVPDGTPDHLVPAQIEVVSTSTGRHLFTIRNDRWDEQHPVPDDPTLMHLLYSWDDVDILLGILGDL